MVAESPASRAARAEPAGAGAGFAAGAALAGVRAGTAARSSPASAPASIRRRTGSRSARGAGPGEPVRGVPRVGPFLDMGGYTSFGGGVGALPGDGCRGTPVVPRQVGDGAVWDGCGRARCRAAPGARPVAPARLGRGPSA
ncbi:hypothetical protein MILUP08_40217 [Micromonospora lupini str. Lupac 08]|uniref:Uncharacterized protein n=1 Tax=Micromonospora lupini str. Lupac 08 TaxID=1150864 RepID=I0LET7_9ACTN|nr:hypothetical protein MILUP08_40217 [Micromonospora lupini str. Lupac 08]